jgi:hypothetical protein
VSGAAAQTIVNNGGMKMAEKFIGQHVSNEGVSGDSGQRHITRDPNLGKAPVPPSKPADDIKTQSRVSRGREPK